MSKMKKFFDVEIEKAAGVEGQMWFTASTEDRDRMGDVVVASGWKLSNYKKNPVFLWAHDYSRPPIGKATKIEKGDGKLRALVEFVPGDIDPFADQVRRLYEERFMRTVSVGFMVYKREDLTDDDKKQRPEIQWGNRLHGELLEFSAVPVPANPMALQNGFMDALQKSFVPLKGGADYTGNPGPDQCALRNLPKELLVVRPGSDKIDPRLARASLALCLGARGGLGLEEGHTMEAIKALSAATGFEWPDGKEFQPIANSTLRTIFEDVWDSEILDVMAHALGVEPDPKPTEPALSEAGMATLLETTKRINDIARMVSR